jgi:hypothetical protein
MVLPRKNSTDLSPPLALVDGVARYLEDKTIQSD